MADHQTTVALNIGSQRISAAVFETSKNGGLVLKRYDSESIIADPAMDSARISQTQVAIGDLTKRLKLGKTKARYAISGQSVFTRFVKLPPLQDDNIEQLVTFEAQQHVPFPLNEVVWDYELIDAGGEKEVVIVAIKTDALDEINAAVNDNGLGTAEVDVAPMAIYNAFRATYGEPEEPVLLIDIGAKTSNLLYIEGKRFFTRSVSIGGSAVTAAIAKEYSIPFMDAEHQKTSNGLVALGGGHTEQMDEAVAALAMVIRNALTRLPAEISRTTNYYRSQHGGKAPKRVYLAGGGANLPYTLEFFQEKLNLPVEYFNPVRNVAIGKGVDPEMVQRDGHLMGELVGLGLRGVGKSQINIDLVPKIVEQSRAADRRKPILIAAAAVLLAGVGGWAMFQNMAAGKAEERAESMDEQKEALAPVKSQIDGLLRKQKQLETVVSAYTDSEKDHSYWPDLLSEIRGAFASDAVWLTDFEPISGFDPLAKPGPGRPGRGPEGTPVVKEDFLSTGYGLSSLIEVKAAPPAQPQGRRKRRGAPPAPKAAMVDAIRISGYWRKNPRSQNVVSELLKKLRSNSKGFKFTLKGPDGKNVELRDEQIMDITVEGQPGELGLPFNITLPLARQAAIK